MIELKNKKEIELMREGGRKLFSITEIVKKRAEPGITTGKLEELAKDLIFKEGAEPSFLGYKGFPAAICTSVNETVVHGIPSERKLKKGDILSIDLGIEWKGYHTDMAVTFPIGEIDEKKKKLLSVTEKALKKGIAKAKRGNRLGDIGYAIESYVRSRGFVVVEGLCGHGIGREVHQAPQILNTGKPGKGMKIEEGFVFCIEPMVTLKKPGIKHTKSGIKTKNPSAHFEHTVAIVDGNPEILTRE